MTERLTDSIMVRIEPELRERLAELAIAMRQSYGVRLSLAAAARCAIERGLDSIEADARGAKKGKR